MTLDSVNQDLYHSHQSAAHASNDASGGSGASVFKCGICLTQDAWEAGLCKACYHHRRRRGWDENPQTRTVRKAKRSVVPRREEPDDDTMTYTDWCESRGYDPKTRTYRAPAQPAQTTQAR